MQKNVYILTNNNPNYRGLNHCCVTTLATSQTSFTDEELYNCFHKAVLCRDCLAADKEANQQKCRIFPNTETKIIEIVGNFDIFSYTSKSIAIVLKTKGAIRGIAKNISTPDALVMQKKTDGFSNFDKLVSQAKLDSEKLNDLMSSGLQKDFQVHVIDFSDRFFPGDENFIFTPEQLNSIHARFFISGAEYVMVSPKIALLSFDLVIEQLRPIIEQAAKDSLSDFLDGGATNTEDLSQFRNWRSKDNIVIVQWWKDFYQSTFESEYPSCDTIIMVLCDAEGKMFFHALK